MAPPHAQTPAQALQLALQQDRLSVVEKAVEDCIAAGVSQAILKELLDSGRSCRLVTQSRSFRVALLTVPFP